MKKSPLSLTLLAAAVVSTTLLFSGCTKSEEAPTTEKAVMEKKVESPFAMLEDASNVREVTPEQFSYETKADLQGVLDFYQAKLVPQGLTEREILTVMSDNTLNLVFDGSENGKAMVIQAVKMTDYTIVTVRYEEV